MKSKCLPVKAALLLVLGIVAGFALLVAVYALPTEPMIANGRASIPAFNGDWAREDSYEQLVPGYQGTQLDNSTDAAMLLAAVHDSDLPLSVRAAMNFIYTSEGNAFGTLLRYGEVPSEELSSVSIARYWHGYLVFLKPLLCLFSYLDIRMLLSITLGCLLAAVIAGLCRRKLERLIPAFVLSLLAITPFTASLSLQFSTTLFTFLIAMLLLLYLPARFFAGHGLPLFYLLTGMATSYVDYLTYPVAAFGMPFVLCLFLFPKPSVRTQLKCLLLCGACWAVGYWGMWAGKWLIASLLGHDAWFLPNLLAKIRQRSSDFSGGQTLSYVAVLGSVARVFTKRAYLTVGVVAVAAYLTLRVRRRGLPRPSNPGRAVVLCLTALLPFAWYFCTKNHTYNHAFYTSRALCVTLFALGSLFLSTLPEKALQR